jgi:hypothetical protein
MRLTMVVREPQRDAAQTAAVTLNQGAPFNPALVTAAGDPTVIVARWCSWVMNQGERDNLLAAFKAQGFSAREANVIDPNRDVHLSDRLFVFDGDAYHSSTVLSLLDLAPWDAGED